MSEKNLRKRFYGKNLKYDHEKLAEYLAWKIMDIRMTSEMSVGTWKNRYAIKGCLIKTLFDELPLNPDALVRAIHVALEDERKGH